MATGKRVKTKQTPTGRYHEAVGRRKTAIARVRFWPNQPKAQFTVNDKPLEIYFPTVEMRLSARRPLGLSQLTEHGAISVKASGGGIHAQAEAVSHGLSRVLSLYDLSLRPVLKKERLLRRDARMKERRKFGLKKARKAPQWSKR